jgi:subtilase family serine protease
VPDARPTARPVLAALILVGALALAASLVPPPAATASQAEGSNRDAQAAAAGNKGTVVIGLRRQQNQLSAFAQARATPGTGTYRDFASVSSLAQRFGATASTWRQVRQYLRSKGIRSAKLDVTRGFATARLSQRQRRRAFPAPRRVRRLIGPVLFSPGSGQRSRSAAPGHRHAATRSAPQRTGMPAGCEEGVGSGGFTPNQYRTAYGVDSLHARGLLGQGMRIAFVETDGFSQPALNQFARCFDFAPPRPTVHLVGLRRELEPGNETQLDIQIAAAIAPLAQMDVFQADISTLRQIGKLVPLFAAPLDPKRTGGERPHVISSSLGFCEATFGKPAATLLDYVLSMAAGAGITIVNASGDNGSSACFTRRRAVAYPPSSIFVTAVGGTRLTLTDGNEIDSEVVWNDDSGSGGGATSRFVHRPAYQQAHPGPFSFRTVPDVAFHSSGSPGYAIRGVENGGWAAIDGTSAAAPLLGAGALLAAQAADSAGVDPPGLLNPLLYQAARDGSPGLFNDITQGNNDVLRVGCCPAAPGYDRASGWGSLDLGALADLVVAAGR